MSSIRLFFKNKLLTFTYFLLFLLINCVQIYGLRFFNQDLLASFSQLRLSLCTSIYYFSFYIFMSLEFFYQAHSFVCDKEFTCEKTDGRSYLNHFLMLTILNFFTTLVLSFYNILAYLSLHINQYDFLFHILVNMLLNFFMIGILGILMGMCFASVVKRPIAYIFSILFVLLSSPAFESLEEILLYNYNLNIYPIFKIFDLYSPSLHWMPNFMFGYSILPYRFALISTWIFAILIILLCKLVSSKITKRFSIGACAALCAISIVIYFQPSSKLAMNYDPSIGLDADLWYYTEKAQKEETGGFDVLSYTMNIDITNQLSADVELKVSKNLPEYKFTLYHGYKIRNVTNQDKINMDFVQDGDYFIVYNDNKEVSELKIEYSGYSTTFYSNMQGAVLPGFFPYYPLSGFREVYDLEQVCFNKLFLDCPSDFHINISAGCNSVYSSLNEIEESEFIGNSKGVTIVSGFVASRTVKGIEIIYPYLDTTSCSNETVEKCVDDFVQKYHDIEKINKIIILPNLNLSNVNTVVYDNYVTAIGLYNLADQCVYAEINPDKLYLYQLVEAYRYDIEYFYQISKDGDDKEIADVMAKKINELGLNEFIEAINIYLYDDNDTRSILDFLNSL